MIMIPAIFGAREEKQLADTRNEFVLKAAAFENLIFDH